MSSPRLIRRAVYTLAAAAFCLMFLPRPAAADGTDIVTIAFSGTSCLVSGSTCTGSDVVTGTYNVNDVTNTVVGSWSFSTPDGTIIGSLDDPAAPSSSQGFPAGSNLFDFETSNSEYAIQLDFSGLDGALLTGPDTTEYVGQGIAPYPPSLWIDLQTGQTFDFLSGSASVVATPEPSSIALLGIGLFGLFILRRKRSFSRFRTAQS